MVRRIYAVYDKLAKDIITGLYIQPNDTVASRSFVDMVRAPDTNVNKHPEDYCLICLGSLVELAEPGAAEIPLAVELGSLPYVVVTGKQVMDVNDPYAGSNGLSRVEQLEFSRK